ncbi:YbjN domain-containing protein [Leptolyngbya sp. AN02str]|uniref:YbjN domain-containing protein n=1 Tax=Leptolyngbya sp. AN02str TaxID=3423363 RepID=UPI003D30FE01
MFKSFEEARNQLFEHISSINLTFEVDRLTESRLKLQVSYLLYETINAEALFNLKPEIRGAQEGGEFQPELDIEIEATLNTELLHHFEGCATNDDALAYLQFLKHSEPAHPLLQPANWYALRVWQTQNSDEVGYRTLWFYMNPALLTEDTSSEAIAEAILQFLGSSLEELWNDNLLKERFNQIFEPIDQWLNTSLNTNQQKISQEIDDAANNLASVIGELFDALISDSFTTDSDEPSDLSTSLMTAVVNFFTAEDWSFSKAQGQLELSLSYTGKHGAWTCLAKVREGQNQLIFYSIFPVMCPQEKQLSIVEFLARINHKQFIGNFEMDFNSGNILFRTSLDFADLEPDEGLIHKLVEANIEAMDSYFLNIQDILDK